MVKCSAAVRYPKGQVQIWHVCEDGFDSETEREQLLSLIPPSAIKKEKTAAASVKTETKPAKKTKATAKKAEAGNKPAKAESGGQEKEKPTAKRRVKKEEATGASKRPKREVR